MALIQFKRTVDPDKPPATLQNGEVAFGLNDVPVRGWIGTPGGVKELFAGTAVEDAEDDAVYGRCNGEWEPVPIVSATVPANPAPNSLWFDTVRGGLYFLFNDGDSIQWIAVGPQIGPRGPQGVPGLQGPIGGTFPDAPTTDGAYLRRNGAWVPLTHMSAVLASNIAVPFAWTNILSLDVGNQGVWFVTATLTYTHTRAAHGGIRLIIGGTTFAGTVVITAGVSWYTSGTISSIITNPAGPIVLQAMADAADPGAQARANHATFGAGLTHMTAMRIG